MTLDPCSRIQFVNPAGVAIFARDEQQLVGWPLTELAHPLDRPALARMLEVAGTGETPARQEVRFQLPGGSNVTTGFSAALGSDRDVTVCVIRDLSGEKALRPQLLHTERMASMGLMASVVAHELNNALAGAIGCVELLRSAQASGREELVETALTELRRSAEIVGDLKGYARTEEGMDDEVRLDRLLESMQRLHRYKRREDAEIRLEVEVPDGLPPVRGNPNQLLQALINLVRNAEDAVRALEPARQVVRLTIERSRDVLTIAVADRGPGIPEQMRPKLFEPFFSTKSLNGGTGLGLTVVQSVAAGHGGRVEIDDNPGGGAVFRLTIPVQEPASDAAPVAEGGEATPLSVLKGRRILVADDEPAILLVFSRVARRYGAEVHVADDGDSAIAQVREHDFDLLFLDVRMPGGGGPAVFRFVQEHRPEMAGSTVFISGEFSSDMNNVVGSGYGAILRKPFSLADLGATARRLLR